MRLASGMRVWMSGALTTKDKGGRMKDERKVNLYGKRPDLVDRTFDFAVKVIRLLQKIKYSKENDVIRHQLAKASTSIGANYEESQGAYSREDFAYKMSICFREARESNYWLRIIKAVEIASGDELEYLLKESVELRKIFSSITKRMNYRGDTI